MSDSPEPRAIAALNAMIGNGAKFVANESAVGRSFMFEVVGAGDRAACRKILAEVKNEPAVFAALKDAVFKLVEAP